MIKAIIWDMDGVLIDSERDHRNAEIATLREFGVRLSHEDITSKYLGYKLSEYFAKLAEDFKVDLPIPEVVARHKEVLEKYYAELFGMVPHADEVLASLRKASTGTGEVGYLMALATSASEDGARQCLTRHGLIDYFDALTFGNDVANGKPAPDIYLLAAERLGVEPADCVVIEDAYTGFVGAKAAGMKVIGRRAAHNDKMDFDLADYVIEDLLDVEGALRSSKIQPVKNQLRSLKIGLLGYGGMGKAVEKAALARGHEVPVVVDKYDSGDLSQCDVVIDFSLGEAVMENVRKCREAGVPVVIGTTGWYEKMDEVREAAIDKEGKDTLPAVACLWSSNFSIGVNLYFKMVEEAAKMINKFDEYDVWGHEIHHVNKADSPSGTAKFLSKILLENIDRKTTVIENKLDRKREDCEIHFSSVRGGLVNFGHTVGFDSEFDTITITHAARNRGGYALGAVKAAEWLKDQSVGFYTMNDFLKK